MVLRSQPQAPFPLQVGKPVGQKLSHTEQRAHFALWALIKSPLIIGCDLRCCTAVASRCCYDAGAAPEV